PVQQLFVVVNLERTERGLAPAVALSRSLNKVAQAGARAGRDPAMASVPRYLPGDGRIVHVGANWSGGWVNPLGADYGWMYDDGPGGTPPGLPDGGPPAEPRAPGHPPAQVRRSPALLGSVDAGHERGTRGA